MTRHADVAGSKDVQKAIPALAALAGIIGDRQVRHMGTLGGSLANSDPAADYPAAVLGLAVLASEYVWARRLLRYTKDRAQGAASTVLAKENRALALSLLLVVLLLVAALVSWYVYRYGWTLDGALGWFGLN